jgi:hypothetical protein
MSNSPNSGQNAFWLTTRPHEDNCPCRQIDGQPKPPATAQCVPGCRVGNPWPTLLLLPHERKALWLPERPVVEAVE